MLRLIPILAVFSAVVAFAEEPRTSPEPPALVRPVAHRHADERPGERQREGARVTDLSGRFELAGDRVTFTPTAGTPAASRESYRLLENLALERVGQVLSESRARQEWTICGTLTEYRGANYLLLTKAVIKTTAEAK